MGQENQGNFWDNFWDSLADTLLGWLTWPQKQKQEELELEQERLRLEQERLEYQQRLIAEQNRLKMLAIAGAIGLAGIALVTMSKR